MKTQPSKNMTAIEISMSEPQLQAPGAGIPTFERLWSGLMIRARSRVTSRDQSMELFQKERATLLQLAESCSPADGAKPVLIKRIRGIEDSSRFWSMFMTLHHLQLVNQGIGGIIQSLCNGVAVGDETLIADVKPTPAADVSMIELFDQGCANYSHTLSECANLRTKIKHRHPWFGMFDAKDWHTLAAMHMLVHRWQIELILAGMK